MNILSLVLDMMVMVIIILITATSIRRGLITSIIEFMGVIISAIVSSLLASYMSILNYNLFFKSHLMVVIDNAIGQKDAVVSQQAFDALPIFVQNEFRLNGITEENILNDSNAYSTITESVEAQAAPVIMAFITKILMVIIFTVLMAMIVTLSTKLAKKLKLEEFNTLNNVLCAVFGIFKAVFIIMILIILLNLIVMMSSADSVKVFNQALNDCLLFKFLYNINIPLFIINLVTGA